MANPSATLVNAGVAPCRLAPDPRHTGTTRREGGKSWLEVCPASFNAMRPGAAASPSETAPLGSTSLFMFSLRVQAAITGVPRQPLDASEDLAKERLCQVTFGEL